MKLILVLSTVLAFALAFSDEVPYGIENRISGGVETKPHQIPYQVGMQMTKIRDGREIYTWCGGSLIADNFVLTAAHCLYEAEAAVIFLGAHNRRSLSEPGRILIAVDPDDWIIHEEYNPILTENDIALILLPKRVPLSKTIQTIRLPTLSENNENYVNSMAIISGWGRTGDSPDGAASDVLRYVHRSIMTNEFCSNFFPMFKRTQICVDGSRAQSACAGDSGGPLVVKNLNGENTLIGLTSYGRAEGCQKSFPVSYTRVSSYLGWISSKTGIRMLP
uniref:Venom polypeptide n=1 Tax=Dolopus genitalis TaxID=2488630 RepID=A0A3G5BIH3_DOLGE|nr:venom polypeptide [Dolopus genitalis]